MKWICLVFCDLSDDFWFFSHFCFLFHLPVRFKSSRIWAVSVKRQCVPFVKCPPKCKPPLRLRLNEQKTSQKIFIQISIGLKSCKRSSRWVLAVYCLSVRFGSNFIRFFLFCGAHQEPNGVPVHLKGGAKDKALYYTTIAMIAVGLAGCAEFIYHLP